MHYTDLLKRSFDKRYNLLSETNNCIRLFNTVGDGINGLAVDYYDGYFLVQIFENDLFSVPNILRDIVSAAVESSYQVKGVLLKDRTKLSEGDDIAAKYRSKLIEGSAPSNSLIVTHDTVKVSVDLIESQNTGLFMDMREVRAQLKKYYSQGMSVLNLFSYTCVFGIHAALNGAKRVVNVDISKPVLRRGMNNYRLNDLSFNDRDFVCADSWEIVKQSVKRGEKYDLVVIDPPTFARSKKSTFSVTRDYPKHLESIDKIASGGFVLTAANAFAMTRMQYVSFHPKNWENVFLTKESSDFPYADEPYLKVGLWKVGK